MFKIRICNGPYGGRERTLGQEPVSIGRDAEATIQILDRSASRFHAEIFPVGGMYFVRDLLSKNGTYLNGEKLEDEELLRENDIIRIGTTELAYESGSALTDDDSGNRLSYDDDPGQLSNTLEFRIDDLSDLQDQEEQRSSKDARMLQLLYQVGRIVGRGMEENAPAQVLDYLITSLPAEHALIFMRNRKTGKLSPHTVRGGQGGGEPVIARTIIRRAVMENRAVLTANAVEDERFNRRDSVILQSIGSVICVPLTIEGQTRGVLYLSRSSGTGAFKQRDLEMISSCAMQLGLYYQAIDQQQHQQRVLWSALTAMVRVLESSHELTGSGERCAKSAGALARTLGLSDESIRRVQFAGLLHHIGEFAGRGPDGEEPLETGLNFIGQIEGFDEVVPLIENCARYLDLSASKVVEETDLDVQERILHVAVAFERAMLAQPEADAAAIVERLELDRRFDADVLEKLKACQIEGNLYASVF